MDPGTQIGETAWAEYESAIRAFEDAWRIRGEKHPSIEEFAATNSPHPTRLLVELVHIDLEFRLRAGEQVRVEDYFMRFPALRVRELAVELVVAEFVLRNRHGSPAPPEEFWLRFPEFKNELQARLLNDGRPVAFHVTRLMGRNERPIAGPLVIPGYEIQGELGRGGMGVVYKARDQLLNRIVAVKTFATIPLPDGCARFAREAEAIARLDHPHIVPVYEVGEWSVPGSGSRVPFFVMKWYSGGSLDTVPAGPGTNTKTHARVVETIARAVHHAHQRGVLHRDLKPSNILLDDNGQPHVADFGLAGRVDPSNQPTLTAIAGTPAYMAPEQACNPKLVSTATDVYGLGAVLFNRLTGRSPFTAGTPLATLELVANSPIDRPSSLNPAVDRDLDTICLKCLDKVPARRYATAQDLADDLERWRLGLPITARPTPAWEYAYRRVRRHPLIATLVTITLTTLVGAVAVLADSNARIREKEKETHDAYIRECAMRYKLEETLFREQRALYLERVASAGRLYSANQLPQAWAVLDQCPVTFRGWEWRYLDSLRKTEDVVLAGHEEGVEWTGFLPDGRVISADASGFIRVWDASKRTEQRRWSTSGGRMEATALHPVRNWVAVADGKAVTIWNADTGERIVRLAGTHWVTFNADGSRLATADGSVVRLWTVPDWQPAGELHGHERQVNSGAFSPDGKKLVTGALDNSIRTWDLEKGKSLARRSVPASVRELAFVNAGRLLVEAHPGAVVFTDPATGELRDRLDHPAPGRAAVASSSDARLLAISGANGEILIWDLSRRRVTHVLRGHTSFVVSVAFSPDGKRITSGSDDQHVRVWDLNRCSEMCTLAEIGQGVGGLSLAPEGKQLAVALRILKNPTETRTVVLDSATGRELHQFPSGTDIAFHPISGKIVTGRAGKVSLWDPITGKDVWTRSFSEVLTSGRRVGPSALRIALSADGSRLATRGPRGSGVQLWNLTDGSSDGVLETGDAFVHALTFFPDNKRLAVGMAHAIIVWDTTTKTQVSWDIGGKGASALAASANGQWLATVDLDGGVRLRDAATGQVIRMFVRNPMRVNTLAFSPDSTRLVTGGSDRMVRVWDVESGQELLSLPGVGEAVTSVLWDGQGDRIYALDDAIRVWGRFAVR